MLAIVSTLSACQAGPSGADGPRATDIQLPRDSEVVEEHLPRHATLDGLLRAHRIGKDVARLVGEAAGAAFDLRALRAGQPYRIVVALDGSFRSFEYAIDNNRFLRVAGAEHGGARELRAEILSYPKRQETAGLRSRVDAEHPSLIAVVQGAGERVDLALQLAEIFSGQIDFNADLQPGDDVEVLFQKDSRDGEFSGYGAILAAVLVNGGRRLQAFRFEGPEGRAGYFDENGQSVRRFFLRSPLPFTPRVTSRFAMRRPHPVHGVAQAHLGVDYAAAAGTPVLAVADGVVVSAGLSGASGRLVRLRHANGYQTYYLHLSAIAKGLSPGVRVSQGDMIGRVGASGIATGPHLDYRLAKRGVFLNPLVEQRKLPPGDPISGEALQAFEGVRDEALEQLGRHRRAPGTRAAVQPRAD